MSKRIYKYVGQSYLDKVFSSNENVTLKCSYPKDFNDPYELFLTIDFNESPEVLAFYAEAVGELPQLPTTCFSRSPTVIPMWAHYADNLKGFAIEFDEALLAESFPESGLGDVDYLEEPREGLKEMLLRAHVIGKPRYVHFLHKGVFNAAYYTKATCWSYEQERRMIVRESEIRKTGELMLMDVPKDCVTALVSGPRTSAETLALVRKKASQFGCRHFQLKIGRTSAAPFFVDDDGHSYRFSGTEITSSSHYCSDCKEPTESEAEKCSWCRIDDSHRNEAAHRNPYRILAQYGMLDSYIESVEAIGRKAREK